MCNSKYLTEFNCTYTNNTANGSDGMGGAFVNCYGASGLEINSRFTFNNARSAGGAILNYLGAMKFINSTLSNNTAINGGGIFNDGSGTLTMINCALINNTATSEGGAIETSYQYSPNILLSTCTFTGNNAGRCGGAINNCGTLDINYSTFDNNTSGNGGAIASDEILNVTGSTFNGNTAKYEGGAIDCDNVAYINFNRIIDNRAPYGSQICGAGQVNATLNWWGSNNVPSSSVISADYTPWIVLSIKASPLIVLVGGTSTVTADLLHDSNGVYHNPVNGVVPYTGSANFITSKGSIVNANFVNGMATSTLTNLSTAEVATISTTVDHQKASMNVTVAGVTISQLISAANYIKEYYEINHALPANVTISGQTISMPQFLMVLVTGTLNINKGNLNPLPVTAVNSPTSPNGSFTSGNILESAYLTVAQNVKNFINTNARAPNYAVTSLGNIPFNKLVYMYSKIINFYSVNNRLPNYVSIS